MEQRNIFLNISPLDHRYYLSNKVEHEKLSIYLSEEAAIRYSVKVELALLEELLDFLPFSKDKASALKNELKGLEDKIDPAEVYAEEIKTQHNIRAMVNVLKKKAPTELASYIHLGATSVDILDTAFAMRIRDASHKVIIPYLIELEECLCRICKEEAHTIQIGRTHGQFAVPITFGFALAEYVARLGKSILRLVERSKDLRGKLAGAVGAYNATSMISKDPEELEKRVLNKLGLKPSEHSTQLVEPEYLLNLLLEINVAFGILANLADDLRHLQRSEIAEIREEFSSTQVGSSTMPQKRNPWNCEHVKSLWKTFMPRTLTFFLDQISEHQRDLTNSASQRFIADYLAGFTFAVKRMQKILSSLNINREQMQANLAKAGSMALAEPAYVLLALAGKTEAHEIIKQLTLEAEQKKLALVEVLKSHSEVWQLLNQQLSKVMDLSAEEFFTHPAKYLGRASQKAIQIADIYKQKLIVIKEELCIQ